MGVRDWTPSSSSIRRRAALFPGEHNAEVYGERIGLGEAELRNLAERGVI